jgi:hypothetical protein
MHWAQMGWAVPRGHDTNGADIAAFARIGVPPGTIERIGAICVMGVQWKFI